MALFGIACRVLTRRAGTALAQAHVWLHQIGALVVLIALFRMTSGQIPGITGAKVLPVTEIVAFLGMVALAVNVFRSASQVPSSAR